VGELAAGPGARLGRVDRAATQDGVVGGIQRRRGVDEPGLEPGRAARPDDEVEVARIGLAAVERDPLVAQVGELYGAVSYALLAE
jgi:hypothetical protein